MTPAIVHAAAPGNYGPRGNVSVDTLVLHVTQSTRNAAQLVASAKPSAVLWFADPAAKASAHYVVGRAGDLYACVPEGECAWHAGNLSVNRRSIGVEVEGFVDRPETWTPEALATLVELSAEIVRRHGIPVVRQPGPGICGHEDVPDPHDPNRRGGAEHHTDPGALFPWDAYFARLRAALAGVA
jgi:N-acetyl-anhydromuramyl-L-alanine amidase AmpD